LEDVQIPNVEFHVFLVSVWVYENVSALKLLLVKLLGIEEIC